jgi:general nucleoside transport system ATP-binding protein
MTDAAAPRDATGAIAVDMRKITKRFGPLLANDAVDFELRAGEIHALLGENGAGKTTLMNVLSGFLHADEGTIFIDGNEVRIRSPMDAFAFGIGMVHQHSLLVPTFTVAENMLLGSPGLTLRQRDLATVSSEVSDLAARNELDVSPDSYVWQLSVGEQQRVEVLRALYRRARILILDEPTASLTPTEVGPLLGRLRGMARRGTAVVLITHHLDEVMACADRITVLRQGKKVASTTPRETTTRQLAGLMVGREIELVALLTGDEPAPAAATASELPPVFAAANLEATGQRGVRALHDESFEVRPGQTVAMVGVEGNGQAELEEVLCGLRRPDGGTVHLGGEDITGMSPGQLLDRGVGFIPSDRYRRGLIRALSVADNLAIDRIDRPPYNGRFGLHPRAILETARPLIERFSIRASSPKQRVGALSGGNAQRVVLARALSHELRVLVASQPSRGLDVGAIDFVWDQLRAQRDAGVAVILLSTDLNEAFALADVAYVMYRGRLVGPWARPDFDLEEFGLAMGGAKQGGRPAERLGAHGEDRA